MVFSWLAYLGGSHQDGVAVSQQKLKRHYRFTALGASVMASYSLNRPRTGSGRSAYLASAAPLRVGLFLTPPPIKQCGHPGLGAACAAVLWRHVQLRVLSAVFRSVVCTVVVSTMCWLFPFRLWRRNATSRARTFSGSAMPRGGCGCSAVSVGMGVMSKHVKTMARTASPASLKTKCAMLAAFGLRACRSACLCSVVTRYQT